MHISEPLPAGYFKLASLVQYVPLSTVGGYLGYVSFHTQLLVLMSRAFTVSARKQPYDSHSVSQVLHIKYKTTCNKEGSNHNMSHAGGLLLLGSRSGFGMQCRGQPCLSHIKLTIDCRAAKPDAPKATTVFALKRCQQLEQERPGNGSQHCSHSKH